MSSESAIEAGLELIQDTAGRKYEDSTMKYIVGIASEMSDEEWQGAVEHLIHSYIKAKGDLPTPSQIAQAKREVNAKKPTRPTYPDPIPPGRKLTRYIEADKGRGRPVSSYDL